MKRRTMACAVVAAVAALTAAAEDFALTFKTIPAEKVMAFPGGYGVSAQLRLNKPAALKEEPKAVSGHPLYGEFRGAGSDKRFVFRLDESKGDGEGYDQLIVDMNQNGDLTDEGVVQRVVSDKDRKASPQSMQQLLFGPVKAPASQSIPGGQPIYFAQGYINTLPRLSNQSLQNFYAGNLRLKAGWYLETTVNLDGRKQKVGIMDSDSNLRLGDIAQPQTYEGGGEKNWYFQPGDSLLVDADGSGAFENDGFETETCPFGKVLYLGATPCQVALSADCKSLRVAPWTDPVAEVALQPQGKEVSSVTLAWEQPGGKWQLLRAGVAEGKIKVPPGKYRLYTCTLLGKAGPRDSVMVSGYQRVQKPPFNFAVGKANSLRCGAPLDIKVAAEKRRPESWEVNSRTLREAGPSDSEYVLSINAHILGCGGEIYSSFGKGEKFEGDPPKPAFTVKDAGGKQLANGNLEFG